MENRIKLAIAQLKTKIKTIESNGGKHNREFPRKFRINWMQNGGEFIWSNFLREFDNSRKNFQLNNTKKSICIHNDYIHNVSSHCNWKKNVFCHILELRFTYLAKFKRQTFNHFYLWMIPFSQFSVDYSVFTCVMTLS